MPEVTLWIEESFENRNQTGWCVTIAFRGARYTAKADGPPDVARRHVLRQVSANLGIECDINPCYSERQFIDQLREMSVIQESRRGESSQDHEAK